MKIDTSDPGLAANVAARAAILFSKVSGMIAENQIREQQGQALAFDYNCFESVAEECFPELKEK
jgi:hypothetical protein